MISRRRIISRSLDPCDYLDTYLQQLDDENTVWLTKEELFADHIQEVFNKWEQIDDEIWAKVICMNGKRRIAKAYARAPVLTIDGSHDGFDGYRIGLNGFDNPFLDVKTEDVMRYIGKGCRIKMDETGNIVIKRYSRCSIFIKSFQNEFNESSVSNEIIKNNGLLELEKPYLLFDMSKFNNNVTRELRSAYPNRKKLENQCLLCIAFVRNTPNILDLPVYVMIINIVALDLLKSKLTLIPHTIRQNIHKSAKSLNRGTTKVPDWVSLFDKSDKHLVEENPYSLPVNGSVYDLNYYTNNGTLMKKSTLREPKPPKLPPRDFGKYKNTKKLSASHSHIDIPTPDYSQDEDFYTITSKTLKNKSFLKKDEDPYYCGLEARVTNFMRPVATQSKKSMAWRQMRKVFSSGYINTLLPPLTKKKRSKSSYYSNYNSSESDPYTSLNDTIYEPIYGRVTSNKSMPSTVRSKAGVNNWNNRY
ncbi:uncharacterized protein LOC128962429 [Oppia nitens]|uniref:uncharacterized protein LOC128962429 n=1 Tax=Oppia nitens TaxID=1686743 RepID=UPI0023DA0DA4|nr:uncharacterized protein LOC128962429 [Oppia nitens]